MRVDTALQLVNDELVIYPDWTIRAEDHTHRYQDTIKVHLTIAGARASEREHAPTYGVVVEGGIRVAFPVHVGDIASADELVGRVIDLQLDAFAHEVREFTRLRSTGYAPFHPHTPDGIHRWADRKGTDPRLDYLYGS
jgi:hypothetical protein